MNRRIKIVADIDIPYLRGVLEPYADVIYIKGIDITAETVKDANALLIRTRTRCDANLLDGSDVRFIASATIGTDHIDLDYCKNRLITVCNAPGSNSSAVTQYFFTTLYTLATIKNIDLKDKTIGIIGVGNVGGKIAALSGYLGFKTLLNDPPREAIEGGDIFTGLEDLLNSSDIVTLHVPLEKKNHHLADEGFFKRMKEGAIFFNTSRGEVVDESSLIKSRSRFSGLVLDVWEHEPHINPDLVKITDIATPHIAGYSIEGKINATTAIVRALARFFGIEKLLTFTPKEEEFGGELNLIDLSVLNQNEISSKLQEFFPVLELNDLLRSDPDRFEQIRMNYRYRREFYVYKR